MADLKNAVRVAKQLSENESAGFLTELSTQHRQKDNELLEPGSRVLQSSRKPAQVDHSLKGNGSALTVETAEAVLGALRSEPDLATLSLSLKRLQSVDGRDQTFSIRMPGPIQAQIIHVLVSTVVPTFWPVLDPNDVKLLVACLRCVAGIQALIAHLRQSSAQPANKRIHNDLMSHLSAINQVLQGEDVVLGLWTDLGSVDISNVKRDLVWKEVINILASGKVITAIAHAEDAAKEDGGEVPASRLSKGSDYAAWLGRNIVSLLCSNSQRTEPVTDTSKAAAQLLAKSLSLGYSLPLVNAVVMSLLDHTVGDDAKLSPIRDLFETLPTSSKRMLMDCVLRWLSTNSSQHLIETNRPQPTGQNTEISGFAALLSTMIGNTASSASLLSSVLTDASALSSLNHTVRRAIIAVISQQAPDELETLLERIIAQFYDRLFINHAPLIQQEGLAQVLLLVAGYLHRQTPMAVLMCARSSGHMQGVSNRLDTSNQRARWLGMVSGVALSSLIDKEGSRMSFGTDDMETEETKWYLRLIRVDDEIGTLQQLRSYLRSRTGSSHLAKKVATPTKVEEMPIIGGRRMFGPPRPPQTEIVAERVTEVFDEPDDDGTSDLRPYAKPDSDPEDSDEDATLVNRNKPKAPVYIRDLMRMLRDEKDHDRFQLGIKHAATLIRRKANFGNEVKDHAEELASMLCNLQDPFNTPNFDAFRLQALIAVLLTNPPVLAPWLIHQAFAGDYSLSQRCLILSALGLGGRELAGFKNEDRPLNPDPLSPVENFPTKRLPHALHTLYSPHDPSVSLLESAAQRTEQSLMAPLALSAADHATAHLNPVKIRTFSSRLAPERVKRRPAANPLAQIFVDAFFSPLVRRYRQDLAAYGRGTVFASAPVVLVTYVKTVALLLHAAGPGVVGLGEVTAVFWDLLLDLRVAAATDGAVREAVLFALLTLLEVNGENHEGLAREMARQVVETRRWVEVVFENLGGNEGVGLGGEMRRGDQEARVRTLAAGVLVRTGEVVEAYQKVLRGNVPDF